MTDEVTSPEVAEAREWCGMAMGGLGKADIPRGRR